MLTKNSVVDLYAFRKFLTISENVRKKLPRRLLPFGKLRNLWANGKFSLIFLKLLEIAVPFTAKSCQISLQWKAFSIFVNGIQTLLKNVGQFKYNVHNLKVDTLTWYKLHRNFNLQDSINATLDHNLYLCIILTLTGWEFFPRHFLYISKFYF